MQDTLETRSTCPYCGVGCGVIIAAKGTQIIGVRGDPDHPANMGRLCSKGATLHLSASDALTRQNRLLQPQWRDQRGGALQAIGWDAAIPRAAGRVAQGVRARGPAALGVCVSGQLLTGDYDVVY